MSYLESQLDDAHVPYRQNFGADLDLPDITSFLNQYEVSDDKEIFRQSISPYSALPDKWTFDAIDYDTSSAIAGLEGQKMEAIAAREKALSSQGGFASTGTAAKLDESIWSSYTADAESTVSDIRSGYLAGTMKETSRKRAHAEELWDLVSQFQQAGHTYRTSAQGSDVTTGTDTIEAEWEGGFDQTDVVVVGDEIVDEYFGDEGVWGYRSFCCPTGKYNFFNPCCHFG